MQGSREETHEKLIAWREALPALWGKCRANRPGGAIDPTDQRGGAGALFASPPQKKTLAATAPTPY